MKTTYLKPRRSEIQRTVDKQSIPIVFKAESAAFFWIDLPVDVEAVKGGADREMLEQPVFQSQVHFRYRSFDLSSL